MAGPRRENVSGSDPAHGPDESGSGRAARPDVEPQPSKPTPAGASIAWDIPGDVPSEAMRRRASQASPEDSAPDAVPPAAVAETSVRSARPPSPHGQTENPPARRKPNTLLMLLALLLLLGLGGVGYGYFADSTGRMASAAAGHGNMAVASVHAVERQTRDGSAASAGRDNAAQALVVTSDAAAATKTGQAGAPPAAEATDGAAKTHSPPRPTMTTYVVKKGDTLWDIATKYLHDPFRYHELARLSHIRDPHWIYPGDVIRIPA